MKIISIGFKNPFELKPTIIKLNDLDCIDVITHNFSPYKMMMMKKNMS